MSEYIVRLPISGTTDVFMKITGEIVRCRDCKHYEEPQPKNGWNGYCTTKEHDTVPDGFCKWGERRSE